MNSMSSGMRVFFIQKATGCGVLKSNSMPRSAARYLRNIRPRSRVASVSATSTVKWRTPLVRDDGQRARS